MKTNKSRIEKLISELCPNGVGFLEIGKVCNISRGRVMSKDYLTANKGEYPVYSSQTANEGIFGNINTYDYDGEYVTWTTDGANAGSVFYRKGKFSITNVCGLLRPKNKDLNIKYLSYILGTMAKSYVNAGMGNPKLMSNVMSNVKIPIPPLPIQEEIVTVLDSFTELETELESELESELETRKRQYNYYKEELLEIENVEFKSLSEILLPTENIKWKDAKNTYKYIDLTSVSRDDHTIKEVEEIDSNSAPSRAQKILKKDDVIFATTRPTLKRYAMIDDIYEGQIASTGYCVLRANKKEVLPKWIYFNVASNRFNNYVEGKQEGVAYPSISDSNVKNYNIPIPSLPEQERIVSILDKFDALVNDISVGLPAELKARRQQYEYYRNQLLTFKELEKYDGGI